MIRRPARLQRWVVLVLGASALAVVAAGVLSYPKFILWLALEGTGEVYVFSSPGGQSGTRDPLKVRRFIAATLKFMDACRKTKTEGKTSPASISIRISFIGKDGSTAYKLSIDEGGGEVVVETREGRFTCPWDDWVRYRAMVDEI